jgi:phage-related minor tail protein
MAEHETLNEVRESRINETVQFFDDEFQRVQKELGARRKALEKEFATRRKTVERRTRKELKRIQSELKKNPIVKRADAVRKDVTKQVETRVDSLLGLMQVASRSDVQRINKKLTTLNRRLKAIEDHRKTNGSSAPI